MNEEKNKISKEILLAEQEISNWLNFWMKDSVNTNYLPKADRKPKSDILDAPWFYRFPEDMALIKTFPTLNNEGMLITSWFTHKASHASWLSSWPVDELGNKDEDQRKIWQPNELKLIVDMDLKILALEQSWKNPKCVKSMIIGKWEDNSQGWLSIVENAEKRKPFTMVLPSDIETYNEFSKIEINSNVFMTVDKLKLTSWKIDFVFVKNNNLKIETSANKLRILH